MVMTMGFETLPHNDAAALMNHLATKGEQSMRMILVAFKIFLLAKMMYDMAIKMMTMISNWQW